MHAYWNQDSGTYAAGMIGQKRKSVGSVDEEENQISDEGGECDEECSPKTVRRFEVAQGPELG